MQLYKHSLIASALAMALTGCGSDSSNSNNNSTTITAIDGYLYNAEVYVDRNENGVADTDEKIGTTAQDGTFAISEKDAQYDRIIRAIAGITSDSDVGGTVLYTYEMISKADSDIVTPFTTLAHINKMTMTDLASRLNLDEALISSDYVAQKQGSTDAQKVHLIARSAAATLSDTYLEADKLLDTATKIADEVANIADDELDNTLLVVDKDGNVAKDTMRPTIEQFMTNKTYYSFSLNRFWRSEDGVTQWQFDYKNSNATLSGEDEEGTWSIPAKLAFESDNPNTFYVITDEGRSEMTDNFIYLADGFGLAHTVDKDLSVYINKDPNDNSLSGLSGINISSVDFSAGDYHHLVDLKAFDPNKDHNIQNKPWLTEPKISSDLAITEVEATNDQIKFNDTTYTVIADSRELYLLKDNDGHPSILTKSQALAEYIKENWIGSEPSDDD